MKKISLFKDICLRFAEESHCLSKKVACLAIKEERIIATGINGTPVGWSNCDDYWYMYYLTNNINMSYSVWIKTPEWRELHHAWSEKNECHAESCMVAFAAQNGISLKDSEIIISLSPCINCAKLLVSLKPKAIYYINEYDKGTPEVFDMFKLSNIEYHRI